MFTRTVWRLTLAATMTASPLTLWGAEDELPIRDITLYRSGVGYFQREGQVEGDAEIQLRFDTDQVNDILKSMVLMDLDGGRIEAVGYGSKEPVERRLASFAIDVSKSPSLYELFHQLRGLPVSIRAADMKVSGTVLSVEQRADAVKEAVVQRGYVNVLTDAGLVSVGIDDIRAFEITDQELAGELRKALAVLAEHRTDTTKDVSIVLRGKGDRRVIVAYVQETPVWKASYRLVLGDDGGKPLVQGWAIVENTTDEDWSDVQLSLVSGRPVSFTMDLYTPLHAWRPEVPVPTVPGVGPRVYEKGLSPTRGVTSWDEAAEMDLADAAKAPSAAPMRRSAGRDRSAGLAMGAALESSVTAAASAVEVGEVFQYRLDAPVTIERQRSAMLPILSSQIKGRRVSIYNRNDASEHPMRGVEITNDSGLQLLPGPISVFDGEAYAGDAQIGHVAAGDTRLLAYAVDLDVTARVETSADMTIQSLSIASGVYVQTRKRQSTTKYAFESSEQASPRTLLVEHPKNGGWTLVEPKTPEETTDSLYRFEVGLAPGKASGLKVVEEYTDIERTGLLNMDLTLLQNYARNGQLSKELREAFNDVAKLKYAVEDAQRELRKLDAERDAITTDQQRIRENLRSVGRETDLYARYLEKLNEQESRLETLVELRAEADKAVDQRTRALEEFVRSLTVRG